MYYATFNSREEDIYNGWEVVTGSLDLHRFNSKKERDDFVDESDFAEEISSAEARENHKEQFSYWEGQF